MHQTEGTSQKFTAGPLPGTLLKTSLERDKRGSKTNGLATLHPGRTASGGTSVHAPIGGSQGQSSGASSNQNLPATSGFMHAPVANNLSSGASSRHILGTGKKGLTRVISSPGIPGHSQQQRKKKIKKPVQAPGRSSCEPGVKKSNSRNSMMGPRTDEMKHSTRRPTTRESGRYLDGDNSAPLIKVTLGEDKIAHKGPKKSVLKAFFEGVKSDSTGIQAGKSERVLRQNELQLRHSKSRPMLLTAEAVTSNNPHSTSLQAKALGVLKRRIKSEQFGEEHQELMNLHVPDVVNGQRSSEQPRSTKLTLVTGQLGDFNPGQRELLQELPPMDINLSPGSVDASGPKAKHGPDPSGRSRGFQAQQPLNPDGSGKKSKSDELATESTDYLGEKLLSSIAGKKTITKSSSADYNVTDLFNQIYNEMESPDRKKIRGDITRFYLRTSESIKVPETELSYYRMAKVIGKGSFGKVYLGQQVLTSRLVAIKCLEKNHMKDRGVREKILQEIDILKAASQGTGITRLYEVFENKTSVFLVMAYARSGDLLRYLKSKTRLEESEAKRLFLPILTAVCGLHSRNILHRDIKLDNILLDEHNNPSLCDFGVSRKMNEREVIYEQCGTPAYIAPEIINEKGYLGFKADVWSLGVMLFAMLTGKMPFKGSTIEDLHGAITTGSYAFPPEPKLSAEAKELILKMMKVDTKERLSSLQVLNEKWLGLSSQEVVSITQRTLDHRVFIDPKIVERVSSLGYPEKVITNSLQMRKLNHATACYYTLEKGQSMFSSGQEV